MPILQDEDKYSTDFTKCLEHIKKHITEIVKPPPQKESSGTENGTSILNQTLEIVILGGLGGRVDQAFSQVHHLYMMTQAQRQLQEEQQSNLADGKDTQPTIIGKLYLVSEESITFVLQKGQNTIYTPGVNVPPSPQQENVDPSRKRKRQQDKEPEYFFEENIGIIPLTGPAFITTHGFEWDVEDWRTEIGGQLSTSNWIRADKVEVETSTPVLFTVELAQRLKR